MLRSLVGLMLGGLFRRARPATVAAAALRVIVPGDSPAIRQIVEALRGRFPALQVLQEIKGDSAPRVAAINAAIGPAGLQAALEADLQGPIVGLFVSRQTFERQVVPGLRDRATAIFAEASPDAQMQLIARLFQRRVSVGVLLSTSTQSLEPDLRKAARRADLALQVRSVAAGAPVVREAAALASQDVLLAVPDSTLYSAETLPAVLESTYRRSQPVVGFSPALVTAGTLATAYAAIDDVLATFDDLLTKLDSGRLPEPNYPRFWRIAVNETVARSLNVLVTDDVRNLGAKPPARIR